MSSVNQVTLLGNVGKDPEIKSLQNGNKVANFSIATSERWRDKNTGEQKEKTDWHAVVIFSHGNSDGLVGIVDKYVRKGSKILVQGALKTRQWEDQSGQKRYTTEVVLSGFDAKLVLLSGKGDGERSRDDGSGSRDDQTSSRSKMREEMDDEIPF